MSSSRRLALAVVMAGALAPAASAQAAETIYAVTASGKLVSFSSDSPGNVSAGRPIAGLQAGESVEGIDVRPATGDLTALASSGRLYTIDPRTAQATQMPGVAQLSLNGTRFGVDFNPLADALRIVSDTGQNLRVPMAAGSSGAATADAAINPATASVTGAAYSNAFHGTVATDLFDIDTAGDQLVKQVPPNNGTLVPVGVLGVDVSKDVAFDIAPSDGAAYLAARVEGEVGTKLFAVNTATGAAQLTGPVAGEPLTGIAVARQEPALYVLYDDGVLATVRSTAPFDKSQPLEVLRSVATSNLEPADALVGIDVRPATGELLGVGDSGRVYVLDPRTGRATSRTQTPFTLSGTDFGVDFNPVPDALRIVSDDEQNLRIPMGGTGTPVTDGALNPGDPAIVGAAYLNPFAGTATTALFDIDDATDQLLVQNPPNDGTLAPVGPLGQTLITPELGFDIAAQDNAALLGADVAALAPSPAGTALLRVDLVTGTARRVAAIPGTADVSGLTIAGAGTIGLTAAQYTAKEGTEIQIGVVRDGGEGTATVNWAVAGSSGALTFAPGETFQTFSIPNPEDTVDEPAQALAITLGRAAGGYKLGTVAATLTIADDDPTVLGPAPDRVKPVVLLAARDLRLRSFRRTGVRIAFSCNEACTLSGRLTLGGRTVGSGSARLAGPGVTNVRARLSRSGRKRVGTGKARTLKFVATVKDAAGNTTIRTVKFRVTR